MNKKLKCLSVATCGLLIGSNLLASNVKAQVKKVNTSTPVETSINYMSLESYEEYAYFDNVDVNNIAVYLRIPSASITPDGLAGFMIRNCSTPADVAFNVSEYLFDLGPDYIESVNRGKGVVVLRSSNNMYTIAPR